MDAIKTETYKGYEIRIHPDEMSESPRTFGSEMGTMVCFHGRYILGDKTDFKSENFSGWADLEKHLREEYGAVVVLPLFLYDHSGLRMKVGSFNGLLPQGHAEFDSGQVGFIYTDAATIRKLWGRGGKSRLSPADIKKAQKELEVEVAVYDQFLSGDVYGYRVVKPAKCEACGQDDDEEVESCWGFYGMDETLAEAKRVVDVLVNETKAAKAKARKGAGE